MEALQFTNTDHTGETHDVSAMRKVRNRRGDDFVVTVTVDGSQAGPYGGRRMARANAVIMVRWPHKPAAGFFGARASFEAAAKEAKRLCVGRKIYGEQASTTAWAAAVPVDNDPSHDWDNEVTRKAMGL